MEGLRHRREPTLSLQRDFSDSRLEEQILKRVFELVIPVLHQEVREVGSLNTEGMHNAVLGRPGGHLAMPRAGHRE